MKFKLEKKELLVWMQPGASKRRQILSVVRVQRPPADQSMPIMHMLRANLPATLSRLIRKAEEEGETGAKSILLSMLDAHGLLQESISPKASTRELVDSVLAMDNEVMMRLGPKVRVEHLEEVPGARELLEELTLHDWMEALSQEVRNPE